MARDTHRDRVLHFYDTHPINERQILEKLAEDGIDLAALSEDDLQNHDQDHYGGLAANDELARLAGLDAACRVLDVCSGMGGPARYLAHNYRCRVTGIDLTQSRVDGANKLTKAAGLDHLVDFHCANALDNPFAGGTFDVVISQEAFCHVPDKPRLIAECVRVLKTGGRMAFTDIVARGALTDGDRQRLQKEMAQTDLITRADYRDLLERQGCSILEAADLSDAWTTILVDRLAMYRGLKDQTIAQFGTDHFRQWDAAYSFFVGLFQNGALGGGRFLARKG